MIDIPIWIIITISFLLTFAANVKSNGLKDWATFSLVCFAVVCLAALFTGEDVSVKIYAVCLLLTTIVFKFVKMRKLSTNVG